MADTKILDPNCCDDECEDGKRGKRGKRGRTGPTGPTGSTGPTGPAGSSDALIAAANVDGATGNVLASSGFSSVVRTAPGVYDLTLAPLPPPPPDAQVIPTVTIRTLLANAVGTAFVSGGVITVRTLPSGGAPSDFNFYVTVHRV